MRRIGEWFPLGADRLRRRPEVGDIVGLERAAWTVMHVRVDSPTEDEQKHINAYLPAYRDQKMPYRVTLRHLHGPEQERQNDAGDVAYRVAGGAYCSWWYYPSGRVPLCSCCGDPWPCRMLDAERDAEQAAEVMSGRMDRTMPGCCYGCGEPITQRQKSVRYPEPNVQVPGAGAPTFHLRNKCWWSAVLYERDRAQLYPDAPPLATQEHGWELPDRKFGASDNPNTQTAPFPSPPALTCDDAT